MPGWIEWSSLLGLLVLIFLATVLIRDFFQSQHSVLRNFPVIGHLRYFLERQGVFFRQYFFADDREERPFDRATRTWVYGAAKGQAGLIGFGSTQDWHTLGTVYFVNAPFARLASERCESCQSTLGEHSKKPYVYRSLFNISGMSYGALSARAVQALSIGAAEAGVWLNTGEGGLSEHHRIGGCDLIFQIGTAKYGVRDDQGLLSEQKLRTIGRQVRAFEIKLAQGAKPGKGGVLPGIKVTPEIARIRGIPVGEDSISPNRHLELSNPDDLLDMIAHIRQLTGRPVGIKTVIGSEHYPQSLCTAILKRGIRSAPDFITVDGGNGGTAAAPQALADYVGLPLQESLPILIDTLMMNGLKERIQVIASGQLVTADRVAWALCMGADSVVSGRGFLFALGCLQSMQCHQNTCPTGITTHNPHLERGLVVQNKARRVAQYAQRMMQDVNMIAHSCGLADAREFRREHARMVIAPGQSRSMDVLYPYPENFRKLSATGKPER